MKPTGNKPYLDHLSPFEREKFEQLKRAAQEESDASLPPYRAADARRDYPELKRVVDHEPSDGRRRQKSWAKPLVDNSFRPRPFFKKRR